MEASKKIEQILKEIKEYQEIHSQSQEQILKLVKNIEEIKKEIDINTTKKEFSLSNYKRLHFKGGTLLEETPENIKINCSQDKKTKTTQRRFTEYAQTYDIPLIISGKKIEGDEKVTWCNTIEYKGEIIPFKKNNLLLVK